MANTKKTTKAKPAAENIKPAAENTTPAPAAPTPKKFAPNDQIPCRSVTVGELIHVGVKTRIQYTWADYGDVAYLEYQDLQALQSMKSRFILEPLFIIDDEDVVAQWEKMLKPVYDKIKEDDLEQFFALPQSKFESVLKNAPKGFQNSVKTKAVSMIQDGELDSLKKIKAIDEILGTEFAEMFIK
jgi:hypothetical protein